MKTKLLILTLSSALAGSALAADQLAVKAVNKLQLARPQQTIELTAKDLAGLAEKDPSRIHVKDASGRELLCQAVDTDFDERHRPDTLIFQADFAPGETKTFTVYGGDKHVYTVEQFKAYGRFNRERFDDFIWENDRIAHRTYGKGLETWAGEPLTSSTIDIWSKRTPKMVVNEWYMSEDYHRDNGGGADFYSAGPSRGCGGSGLWAADKLWVSKNFINSRVLSCGPIRILFELDYEPFEVNGRMVAETKRISLDAGSQLDRFQSTYKPQGGSGQLIAGIGLKKVNGEQLDFNPERGWLVKWEPVEKNAGQQGLALIADPQAIQKKVEDQRNHLLLVELPDNNTVSYWAGFAWDKAGHITNAEAWKKYVDEFAQGVRSPIEITVAAP